MLYIVSLSFHLYIISETYSYVLIAANLDDFKSIAKVLMPEGLANRVAGMASNIVVKSRSHDENKNDPDKDKVIKATLKNIFKENKDINKKLEIDKGMPLDNTKITFDELVEMVKERIKDNKKAERNLQQNSDDTGDNNDNNHSESDKKYDRKKNKRNKLRPAEPENAFYSKVKMVKQGDSYEDYVTPEKEEDIFESEEERVIDSLPEKPKKNRYDGSWKTNDDNPIKASPRPSYEEKQIITDELSIENNKRQPHYSKIKTTSRYLKTYEDLPPKYEDIEEDTLSNVEGKLNGDSTNEKMHSQEATPLREVEVGDTEENIPLQPEWDVSEEDRGKPIMTDKKFNEKLPHSRGKSYTPSDSVPHDLERNSWELPLRSDVSSDVQPLKAGPKLKHQKRPNQFVKNEAIKKLSVYSENTNEHKKSQEELYKDNMQHEIKSTTRTSVWETHNRERLLTTENTKPLKYSKQQSETYIDIPTNYDNKPNLKDDYEVKAQTGYLSDYKVKETPDNAKNSTPIKKEKAGKAGPPTKGTMIPKRDFYKVSSPNYLAKVPIVAEKYNFDEPIPDNDRLPENFAQIGPPPVNINGRMVL